MSMLTNGWFVDRKEELAFLQKRYTSPRAEFLIIYGRRRVGKTELIKQFIADKQAIYHLVSRETEKDQIEEFHITVNQTFPEMQDLKDDWEALFKNLQQRRHLIVVIDEFQNLISTKKEILSRFQKIWDEHLKKSTLMLILTGSSVGMMETEVLAYKSPLYGRRTGQWNVQPLPFSESRKLFKTYSIIDQIRTYCILGGVPFFLEQFESEKTVKENIAENIVSKGSVLREETRNLLREELREPKNYFSILKTVAHGSTTFNEIVQQTGIKQNSVNKYLLSLRNLHLLEKKLPVTADRKSKRGKYFINDNYFNFWFRYVFPNETFLELDYKKAVNDIIWPSIDNYVSLPFETVCQEILQFDTEDYSKIGTWWYQDQEIDIVAVNERKNTILFGECKWTKKKMNQKTYEQLRKKANDVKWHNKERKEEFVLFSKSGFTSGLMKTAESECVKLYDLNVIKRILERR